MTTASLATTARTTYARLMPEVVKKRAWFGDPRLCDPVLGVESRTAWPQEFDEANEADTAEIEEEIDKLGVKPTRDPDSRAE